MRYMGVAIVRLHSEKQHVLRNKLICHGVSRTFKLELNSQMRNSPTKESESLKRLIVDHLNLLFGESEESLRFWKTTLSQRFASKFFPQLRTMPTFPPCVEIASNLRSYVLPDLRSQMLSEIKEMMGMKLKDADLFEPMHLEEVKKFHQIFLLSLGAS